MSALSAHELYHLKTLLLQAGHIDRCACPPSRKSAARCWPAALSVMLAVVEQLNITELEVTHGALRQGLLHDLLEHEPPADKRLPKSSPCNKTLASTPPRPSAFTTLPPPCGPACALPRRAIPPTMPCASPPCCTRWACAWP